MAKTLRGVECVNCAAAGHFCQAQMRTDAGPLCLRCADGEKCCYETSKLLELPAWRKDEQPDVFSFVSHEPHLVRRPPIAPQAEVAPVPVKLRLKLSSHERAEIRAELRRFTVEQVAARHCIALDMAERIRADFEAKSIQHKTRQIRAVTTARQVQKAVAERFGIAHGKMMSRRRFEDLCLPRQVAMYLTAAVLGFSKAHTGRAFGVHHTTAMYAISRIARMIEADMELRVKVEVLAERLAGPNSRSRIDLKNGPQKQSDCAQPSSEVAA